MKNKLKIVLAQLNPVVGDVKGNAQKLINIRSNLNNNIDMIVVPGTTIISILLLRLLLILINF